MTTLRNRANNALTEKIAGMRAEAKRLADERVYSARQATDNMAKARQLEADADWLEKNYGSHEVQAWLNEKMATLNLEDAHALESAAAEFSALQNEFINTEDLQRERVADAMNALVYDGAIGIDRRTKERQLGRLINGEGETDDKGRRYVNFSEGRSSSVYRAYQTQEGRYAFVLASRGDSTWGDSE